MGGNYNFVLLINCESGLKKIREELMIPDPKLLTEKTEIFTSDDLKGENRKYLPMAGQRNLHVPDNMGGNGRVTFHPVYSWNARTHVSSLSLRRLMIRETTCRLCYRFPE